MTTRALILDHSIVGSSQLPNFTVQKQYNLAGCRLCGALFQPDYYRHHPTHLPLDPQRAFEAEKEIIEWRIKHSRKHGAHEHLALEMSGRQFTPEAAHKLAPFGIVAVSDAIEAVDTGNEYHDALKEAPRLPHDDVEGSTTKLT